MWVTRSLANWLMELGMQPALVANLFKVVGIMVGLALGYWFRGWWPRRRGSHLYWATRRWYRLPLAIWRVLRWLPNLEAMQKASQREAWFETEKVDDDYWLYIEFLDTRYPRPKA